jgi:hypothetical protein
VKTIDTNIMKLKGLLLKETLTLITIRGFAAGIVWMLIMLIADVPNLPFYAIFLYPILIPLMALAFFPVYLILDSINFYSGIIGILTLVISIPGDPILYFLKQKFPNLVPVDKYKVLVFAGYTIVYKSNSINEETDNKNLSSTLIYNSSFGGGVVGRVEGNGLIYNSNFGGSCIGRVSENKIYNLSFGGSIVARYNDDGRVYSGSFGGDFLGSIDNNGLIHDAGLLESGKVIARVEGETVYGAGAAYLALLK